jgi:hypothetical protein
MDDFLRAMGGAFLFMLGAAAVFGLPALFFMALDWLSNLYEYAKNASKKAEQTNDRLDGIDRRDYSFRSNVKEWQEATAAKLDKLQADLKEMKETIDAM